MGVAGSTDQLTNLGFLFGLSGYPAEVQNNGDMITKTAIQYLENHDHSSFICNFGTIASDDELLKTGDRSLWYKVQPYLIGLFTDRGIPKLWQGQEFGDNYYLPQEGGEGCFYIGLYTGNTSIPQKANPLSNLSES